MPEKARGDAGLLYRSGVVALFGLPNAGKSTLFNRLLGEKLAIVTPRPQTTRSRLLGVLTLEHAQLLLLDTPGLQRGKGGNSTPRCNGRPPRRSRTATSRLC